MTTYAQIKNEDDLKKQANQLFEEQEYAQAYKNYSQLVSLYPKDPEYNFRLAVCMLYNEPDKKKPYSYFQVALKNPAEAPKETKFYLAKTYHVNYRFDDAIKLYTEFKQSASAALIKKLEVDREIQACKNGKRLLSNLSDLIIMSKKQLNQVDYFKAYDIKDIGGKLLVKPDDYKSGYDKKKKDKSVVYLPRTGERLYYSSYGDAGNSGRDIYYVNRLPNGSWSKATKLPSTINTEFDEDYPFLHPNGKTLYFSSTGHNSMGGYDIFKTTYNESTQTWSKPENLEFPINSPDDDILFVTDSLEKTAFFSTGRYSPFGKLDVLKINTERRPMNFAIIKGTVVKENASQSLKSKITVTDMSNGEIVGSYQAADNGDYFMELPNGGKFIFKVETPGIPTQSDGVNIPVAYTLKPYRQMISYDNQRLKITNYFDGDIPDENYSMMMDLIEKKAKLDVNENDPYDNSLLEQSKNQPLANNDKNNLNAVNSNNPTVQGESNGSTTPKSQTSNVQNKNVTNEELLAMAKEDAKEAEQESIELKKEAQDAYALVSQKTTEANDKQREAEQIIQASNALTDVAKKNEEINKANQLKEEAKQATQIANTATNLAKRLEVDANNKQQEADLTNQYINQLQNVISNKNNKEALTKLEQIQKELDAISNKPTQSNELLASLKAEADLKQQELISTEKKINNISQEITTLKSEADELEKDKINESDKSLKENISAQIRELNNEIDSKNKELDNTNQKITSLRSDIEGINQSIQIASNVTDESTSSIAVNSSKQSSNNTDKISSDTKTNQNSTNNAISTINNSQSNSNSSYKTITNKYQDKVNSTSINKNSSEDVTKHNEVLKEYNKEINDLLVLDKNELSKTKSADDKKRLSNEIKELEKLKSENDKMIADNTTTLKRLSSAITSNEASDANNNNLSNIQSDAGADDNKSNVISINENNNQNNANAIATNSDLTKSNPQNNDNNITLNNAESTTPLKPISTDNAKKDNTVVLSQLNDLKNSVDKNREVASQLFSYNNYKEQSSISLKQTATQKFELTKRLENDFNNTVIKAQNEIRNNNSQNADVLLNESEELNNKAFEQRKESATKTGAEKDALLKQAIDNEKKAVEKKLEAAKVTQQQNQSTFDLNAENLSNLQKLSNGKESNEISQANMLIDEAALNFKQAKNLRTEADAYPNGAARLGGLSNAEEKENQALAKQQKAMQLLMKANPTFKPKTANSTSNTADIIANINTELNKLSQQQADAYLALSKANQNELKIQNDNLAKNPNFSKTNNQQAKDLKNNSDKLNNEAKALIGQATASQNATDKANLFLKANEKEIEAIKLLHQAIEISTQSQIATVATNQENNTTNSAKNQNQNPTNVNNTEGINRTLGNNQATETATTNTLSVKSDNNSNNSVVSNTTSPSQPTNTVAPTRNSSVAFQDNSLANDIDKLKAELNNANLAPLTAFALYSNNEAIEQKNKAVDKINSALVVDKNIEALLVRAKQLSANKSILNQETISNLLSEAETLNDRALALRKEAAAKPANDKEKDITEARSLEANAIFKKVEAANKQKQLNKANFETNQQSLAELENMAKGKDIAELNSVSMLLTEADLFFKQAKKLREESDAYPNDAAKLGGYSNAEEKENQAIAKQQTALALYKKHFPTYTQKQAVITSDNPDAVAKLNEAKSQLQLNNQTHIQALSLLNEANDKEYASRLSTLPGSLSKAQNTLKLKAIDLHNQSQTLMNKASQTADASTRKANLIQANQSVQESINLLNQIGSGSVIASNAVDNNANENNNSNRNTNNTEATNNVVTATKTNTAATNKNTTSFATNNLSTGVVSATSSVPVKIMKVQGLEVKNTDAYSTNNPIPIDEKMPDGLVFKVQVGAFKSPLPNNTFKGLNPVVAQTTPNGYIRYMAGNFEQYASANAVKNDLRNLGYADAFVVAYFNGQRITLAEAGEKVKSSGQTIELATNTSAGLTTNANVPRNTIAPVTTNIVTATDTKPVEVAGELEGINGLLYTVQIGVYSKQVTHSQLFNLKPIYTEKLPSGLYRYTAGIYNQSGKLLDDKRKVVELGVKDAFVSAYYNAKRISFAEGQKLQAENNNLKLENENPIIFPGANANVTANTNINTTPPVNTTPISNTPAPEVKAFSNGVVEGPAPTAENGVKSDDAGISYKVQIGAYKNQVPNEVAAKFLNIKTWPVKNTIINGLYIYTIGNFVSASYAKTLKEEAVSLGITDAFITVFRDGKKLYGAEASQYLTR